MIKLGIMLGEGPLTPDTYKRGIYKAKEGDIQREVSDIIPTPNKKSNARDIKVQQEVSIMIKRTNVRIDCKTFHHHNEHVAIIKLGKLQTAGRLTFEKYNSVKTNHRMHTAEIILNKELEPYDHKSDVFARLDEAMSEERPKPEERSRA